MIDGFTIFGQYIKFYGLLIALAFVFGVVLVNYFAKRKGFNKDLAYDMILVIFPLAIIGARLYYVAFSGRSWTLSEILAINNGGLAIYGGIIASIMGLFVYAKIKKISFLNLLDIGSPALIIGQAIGRWGNFFNQEAFGPVITNPSLQWFPYGVFIEANQAWHMATFFYESFWNIIGFALLTYIYLKTDKKGLTASLYLIYYGLGRALIEGLRTDSLYIANSTIRVSQALSMGLILLGIVTIVITNKQQVLNALNNFKNKFKKKV